MGQRRTSFESPEEFVYVVLLMITIPSTAKDIDDSDRSTASMESDHHQVSDLLNLGK